MNKTRPINRERSPIESPLKCNMSVCLTFSDLPTVRVVLKAATEAAILKQHLTLSDSSTLRALMIQEQNPTISRHVSHLSISPAAPRPLSPQAPPGASEFGTPAPQNSGAAAQEVVLRDMALILEVDPNSILLSHRSFQKPDPLLLGFLWFPEKIRIPGKNGIGRYP